MKFFRFLVVGTAGFLIDATVTHLLIRPGLSAYLARVPAIALAMIATWLLNRHFTFRSRQAPTGREFRRYLAVAIGTAGLNYLAYALLISLGLAPLPAIVIATGLQAVLSFHAYRTLVFNQGHKAERSLQVREG